MEKVYADLSVSTLKLKTHPAEGELRENTIGIKRDNNYVDLSAHEKFGI